MGKRKRSWRIWLWDVGKQLAGQAVIHALNLLISDQIALAARQNPCSLYFLNVLIDTTIGVVILYIALKLFTWFFSSYLGYVGFNTGQYGNPPRPQFWWKQLAPYLIAIIFMKLLVLLPLTLPHISTPLLSFGDYLLEHLPASVQVVFAMMVIPVIMNVFQVCVVDQFIKAGREDKCDKPDEEELTYTRVPAEDVYKPESTLSSPMLRPLGSPLRSSSSAVARDSNDSCLRVE